MNDISKCPIVCVQGNFDDLRSMDIRFLQEAAKLGGVHVLLFSDQASRQIFGKKVIFPYEERSYYIENIKYIQQVSMAGHAEKDCLSLESIAPDARGHSVIWAVREKEAALEKEAFCRDNNIEYRVIPDADVAGFPVENNVSGKQSKNRKIMVSGCFDWVHSGHVRFFEEVSQFGDLYVVVGHDGNLRLLKGEGHPLFLQQERLYWVQAIRFVKHALISTGHGWLDAAPEIERIRPDMFVVNSDGDVPEKRHYFNELGIEYKVLERRPKKGLPARVSTNLRGF